MKNSTATKAKFHWPPLQWGESINLRDGYLKTMTKNKIYLQSFLPHLVLHVSLFFFGKLFNLILIHSAVLRVTFCILQQILSSGDITESHFYTRLLMRITISFVALIKRYGPTWSASGDVSQS